MLAQTAFRDAKIKDNGANGAAPNDAEHRL
jgi:hypothetical protein